LFAHGAHVFVVFLDRFREGLKKMDYWKLLRMQLEHQSLVNIHLFYFVEIPWLALLLLCVFLSKKVLVFQGHHMALAMEEHTTTEMLGQNNAIKMLKREVEVLGDENTKLSAEVSRLSGEASEVADLRLKLASFRDNKERAEGEVARLKRQVEEAQMSELLAVERASKANETCDNLRNVLDKEKQSSAALQEQVSLLRKQMEELEGLALINAETYKAAVEKFGGQTSALLEEASAFNFLTWLKSHVEKVPSFVGGAVDFAALASAMNFGKMLVRKGCTHATKVGHEALADASSLGKAFDALWKSARNFIGSFWTLFGRASARQMAEERRAKVF
jgi:hypothetical protein